MRPVDQLLFVATVHGEQLDTPRQQTVWGSYRAVASSDPRYPTRLRPAPPVGVIAGQNACRGGLGNGYQRTWARTLASPSRTRARAVLSATSASRATNAWTTDSCPA